MSVTIKPTLGRIVWYRGEDGESRAAIVVGVNGDFNVNLYVFGHHKDDAQCGAMDSVTHADPEQEPLCFPSWHWMPYQIDQAKKQAASTTVAPAGGQFTDLTFGDALVALKGGAKVARGGWNGKGMWLILVPGTSRAELREGTPYAKALQQSACQILPHIDMWTVNAEGRRAMLPGWLASQSDMLAEDWLIVE